MATPKPLPKRILERRGSKSKISARKNEVEPESFDSMPQKPSELKGEAAKLWETQGKRLYNLGLLTKLDVHMFKMACFWYGEFCKANDLCKTMLIKSKKGTLIKNPAITIRRESWNECDKILQRFGFTPSDRAGIKSGDSPKPKFNNKNHIKFNPAG